MMIRSEPGQEIPQFDLPIDRGRRGATSCDPVIIAEEEFDEIFRSDVIDWPDSPSRWFHRKIAIFSDTLNEELMEKWENITLQARKCRCAIDSFFADIIAMQSAFHSKFFTKTVFRLWNGIVRN
jgi:hypothetical protein